MAETPRRKRRSVRSYQRDVRRLRNLLEDIEWVQATYNGAPFCSCCGNQEHFGHDPGCVLARVLKREIPNG